MGVVTAPASLDGKHKTIEFDCGNGTLNEWLLKRALKNQETVPAGHSCELNSTQYLQPYLLLVLS